MFRDMYLEREKPWCHREVGSLSLREVRERGREWEREKHIGFTQDSMMWGSPGSHGERTFPFLEYIWKRVYCLSKDKRPAGGHYVSVQQQGPEAHTEGR